MRAMKSTALCLLLAAGAAVAQQQPASVMRQSPSSREALRAAVAERQRAMAAAAAVFLDKTRSAETRAAAARSVPAFVDPQQVAAAGNVVLDANEPPELRALALSRIEHAVDQNPALITAVLQLAGTPSTPQPLRKEAVRVLADLSFSSVSMRSRSEEFRPTLRKMTSDPDVDVRRTAFSILAAHADDFAQQRLIECVRTPAAPPLPVDECVLLLGLQLHGDALPAIHQVLLHPPDEASRISAIRLLGGFPESRPQLLAILRDASQSDSARLAVLGTLLANTPEEFPALALPLVRDESASDALRVYAIQAVRQRRSALLQLQKGAAIAPFDQAMIELAASSKSELVRKAAQDYLRAAGLER